MGHIGCLVPIRRWSWDTLIYSYAGHSGIMGLPMMDISFSWEWVLRASQGTPAEVHQGPWEGVTGWNHMEWLHGLQVGSAEWTLWCLCSAHLPTLEYQGLYDFVGIRWILFTCLCLSRPYHPSPGACFQRG